MAPPMSKSYPAVRLRGVPPPALPESVAAVVQAAASLLSALGLAVLAMIVPARLALSRRRLGLALVPLRVGPRGQRLARFSPRPPPTLVLSTR